MSALVIALIFLGACAGTLSGLIGIGGGVVLIPALVYLFKLSQHEAQGTTLALLVPPVGILAAYAYYRAGDVNLKYAGLLAIGFIVGGFVGAHLAQHVSGHILARVFGLAIVGLGIKMIVSG